MLSPSVKYYGVEGLRVLSSYCSDEGDSRGFSLQLELTISKSVSAGELYCVGNEEGKNQLVSSSVVSISQITGFI